MNAGRSRLAIAAVIAASLVVTAVAAEERVVERKRVVVRVGGDEEPLEFSYVFVGHQNGEPVVLETELAARGYLGVSLLDLTPELRHHFGAPEESGVMISRIEPDSPAAAADLRAGDVILEIDGRSARSATELVHRIAEGRAQEWLALELLRDGRKRRVGATLETRERRQLDLGGLLRPVAPLGAPPRGRGASARVPLIELDPESLERALSLIRAHLDGAGWREQVEVVSGDRQRIEARIREVEHQLRELERRLEDPPE